MATGSFWDVTDPDKPWGPFDPEAKLKIPIDISAWLASWTGSPAYVSHTFSFDPFDDGTPSPLEEVASSHATGVVTITMRVKASVLTAYAADPATPLLKVGEKWPFTITVIADDGQQDDRTLWLKIRER